MLMGTTTQPRRPAQSSAPERLVRACRDFEGLFIKQLLATTHNGQMGDGLLKDDVTTQVTRDMHDSALADSIGQAGGFGLGDLMIRQLSPQLDGLQTTANAQKTQTGGTLDEGSATQTPAAAAG